ncbi:MAG: hypothetical protein LUI05_03520 [Oscillospiraceae bacterium]|nr:hypothetical protein [Oscillospiraceae bacterium]
MNVFTVEIICPSTSRSYDFKVSPEMRAGDMKKNIISDICLFEGLNNLWDDIDKLKLFRDDGSIISDNESMASAGIRNGSRIMII